jgi:phosphatidyl-myo-inositol alpha-mannosyltransferase
MKLALFHTTLPEPGRKPGGVETVVHRLANALHRYCNLDVTVFSCSEPPDGALYEHVKLFPRAQFSRALRRLFVLPWALNFVDFSRFDVLHLHGDDWFFVRRRLPTVRTLHGSALREAQFATLLKTKLIQYVVYPLEHASGFLATRTLAIGPDAKRIYGAHGLANNGVDVDVFKPCDKAPYPLLCYIGTWQGRKRGQFAFETFVNHVLPQFPNAKLFMACDFVPQHDSIIDGRFPDEAMLAQWLGAAWVFAYPSVYEGFGVPYVEALASGTPIVTSANHGADYVLDGGRYGSICADDEFGPTIVSLLRDQERRHRMATSGLQRAQSFTWETVARAHSTLYESLRSATASSASA